MIFIRKNNPEPSKKRYNLNLDMEDLCSPSRKSWEMSLYDLKAPRHLNLDISELEMVSIPSINYDMKDLKFPVVNFDLKELLAFEKEWKVKRKKFDFDDDLPSFSFHGTSDKGNVESICRDGWRVGDGNGLGSGIYFGFEPERGGRKKNGNKRNIPVPGLPFSSNTLADHYMGGEGALILAEVDWGNFANWDDMNVHHAFNDWFQKNGTTFANNGGDCITGWGLANGYRSVKSPNGGYGVMLQHRFNITQKYWKTEHIRICYVYTPSDKQLISLS